MLMSSSPFWAPEGMLPRADGTVLVALGGLGPLLVYNDCDEKKCSPYKEVVSNASDAPGKGGLADVDGMLCLVEGSTAVYGEGGKLVCEIYDGSLLPIANTRKPDHAQGWEVGGAQPYDGEYDDAYDLGVGNYSGSSSAGMGSGRDSSGRADVADSGKAAGGDGSSHRAPGLGSARLNVSDDDSGGGSSSSSSSDPAIEEVLTNPVLLVTSEATGDLYIVTREPMNEFGFSQGSIHALARREPNEGEECGGAGCWEVPRLVVRSLSNPRGVAIDDAGGTLYVVEQNTLRGYSYETFHGDVLAFCLNGVYDCSDAQNSGECVCARGYGGACCDIEYAHFGSFIVAMATSNYSLLVALLGVFSLVFIFLVPKMTRKRPKMIRKCDENESTMIRKLSENDPKMMEERRVLTIQFFNGKQHGP